MLLIRHIQDHDSLSALTDLLHRGYARLGAMGLNYTAVNQSIDTTRARISGGHCLLAYWDGGLVGTVLAKPPEDDCECIHFRRPDVSSLRQFAVEPSMQGQGIGRTLIQRCEAWAIKQGYRELALDTAKPAVHFVDLYTRLGYKHVGSVQWPGKVYQSIVMAKPLQ